MFVSAEREAIATQEHFRQICQDATPQMEKLQQRIAKTEIAKSAKCKELKHARGAKEPCAHIRQLEHEYATLKRALRAANKQLRRLKLDIEASKGNRESAARDYILSAKNSYATA